MLKILNCVVHEHDLRLVALSAAICAIGCFTTVSLLGRSAKVRPAVRPYWIAAAAGVFGCGVWALHFVAMLAFLPGVGMAYDVALTVASILVSFGGAILSFTIWNTSLGRPLRVVVSGVLLGLGVTGMHYVGVAAMRVSGLIAFDGTKIAASVAVSIVLSTLAFARSAELRSTRGRLESTVWLALAICGLHFTGMAAIAIAPGGLEATNGAVLGTSTLAAAVGTVSLILLLAGFAAVTTEQLLSQRALKEVDRMRLLGNLAHEVLLIQRDGMVLEMNNAGERLFRSTTADIVGRTLQSLFAAESIPALTRRSLCPVENRQPEEMEVLTSSGVKVAVEISCQPIDYLGKPATAIALRDLTERKRDEARIRHLARYDAVTNLPNRYTLNERLDLALEAAAHDGTSVAILYIDLDRFKPVNDLYGHAAGDALLVQVSRRVTAAIGPADTLARIGGDEFVLVLQSGAHPEAAAAVATRVLDALGQPFEVEEHNIEIGASIGIALYPGDGRTADTLLRAADTAMYRVKEEGRNSLRFFEPSMDAQLQKRRQMEKELSRAIANGELLLHYQPILNGITGELETFEALVRWQHPERGTVPPGDFVPLAEETGLITSIGQWVIETACRTAAAWPEPWRVSVNISPVQFRKGDICGIVADALGRNGLEPGRLTVEITEGVLINDTDKAIGVLNRLRAMGIRIALDDFGTGYSSLSYLQRFRFDKFKIDKSFVSRLGQNEDALVITRTIVNLGHNLGLQVTAEGVETVQQLAILRSLGCDQIQGYLVARPGPIERLTAADVERWRSFFQPARMRFSA